MDRFLVTDLKLSVNTFMGFQHIFYAINFLILYLIKERKFSFEKNILNNSLILWIILIAILTVGYRYTQILAVTLAPVALIIAVKRISVFFSAIAGGKLFNEKNLLQKGIATAIMIAGAILLLK